MTALIDSRARLLTPGQVSAALAVSKTTVYRLVAAGDLQAVRVGNQLRFKETAVRAFIDRPPGDAVTGSEDP
jgi:excisionase family DNA binding protein